MILNSMKPRHPGIARPRRRGAALLLAIFVMTVASALTVAMCDVQSVRYSALSNTRNWENARYLAEAGLQHAISNLELDFTHRTPLAETEFPVGSNQFYSATYSDGPAGVVLIEAVGTSGPFSRSLNATVKQGG